jgi:predicted XRE-type DNA-binding protein
MTHVHLDCIPSNGNVFEDLGFKDAKQRLAKAELASRINDILNARGLNQKEAGIVLAINQPKVSALMNGRLDDFSFERLLTFLTMLDQDVSIIIKEKPKKRKNRGVFIIAFA